VNKKALIVLLFSLSLGSGLVGCSSTPQPPAQATADPTLAAEIAKIKAIDNHAHPWRAVKDGETDDEWDALMPDALEPFPSPVRLRPENPEYIAAWRALYGYAYQDASAAHVRELMETKRRVMRERGDGYPAWVLDQLGTETMLANRVAMGRGLAAPRYRWVSYIDALMLPLSSEGARKVNPDYRAFYPGEDKLLKRYLAELQLSALPATLDDYAAKVVTPTLERQRRDGAVAVKFEAAYLRSLDFADAPESEARRIYAKYVKGGEPPAAEYKTLQDYLFRYLAREAGRLGLAVHLHVGSGVGAYFGVSGANPLLLEPAFNDPALHQTNFVLIHGGWPFAKQTTGLLDKPNVYADFSAQTFLLYPRELGEVIRSWLEFVPEKVLFGTDAFAITPEIGWEDLGWVTANSGRQALALALTGMMNDGEITRERALELARMVLRENAIKLYGLQAQPQAQAKEGGKR